MNARTARSISPAQLSLVALVTLIAPVLPAQAQVFELPELEVTSDREDASGPVDGYRAEGSATATRTDTPVREIPQSISVISADQVEDQNAQTIQEALQYSAGVRAAMYGIDNRGDWFTLRGGSEGSVLLNTLRLPSSGSYGYLRNEPYAFERIEVLRGPSSVIAGQNGPGGVVNLVSKRPQAESHHEIAIQYGSYDHRRLMVDSTGALNDQDSLLYRLVAVGHDSGTQVEYADEERQYVAPSLTWLPGDDTALTVFAEYQRDESGNTNAFLPWEGTLYPASFGYVDSDLFIGEPDWDRYGGERVRAGYEFDHRLGDTWTVSHQFRYDDVRGYQDSMYAAFHLGYTGTTIPRIWYASRAEAEVYNADLMFEGDFDLGSIRHQVLVGADAMDYTERYGSDSGAATPLDVRNPVYGTFPRPAMDFGAMAPLETRQVGVLLQDQISVGEHWRITAGGRHDKIDEEESDESATTGRIGVVYLADNGWAPYASYSQSFEPVFERDAQNRRLEPRRGEQYELGAKWAPDWSSITFTAAAYHLTERNRPAPDPDNVGASVQKGEVTVDGVEFEAVGNQGPWQFIGAYSFMDARTSDTYDPADPTRGEQLASIPRHSLSLWAVRELTLAGHPGFEAGGGVRYVGETWGGQGRVKTPSNAIFDAMVSYERDNWRYALNVSNLFNDEYIATCLARGDCWFGAQRKVVGTVAYQF